MSEPVIIRRSGNLLEVRPHCETLLGPQLTYQHRIILQGSDATAEAIAAERENRKARMVKIKDRKVYSIADGGLLTFHGLLPRIRHTLSQFNVPHVFEDLREPSPALAEPNYDLLARRIDSMVPSGKFTGFRPGQAEVIDWMVANDYGLVNAPTGWGKSFLVRVLSLLFPKAYIIVVVPGKALRNAMYEELRAQSDEVGRVGGNKHDPRRITIATPQSILHAPVDKCDILIYDECHTAAASSEAGSGTVSISDVLAEIRRPYKWFGFSATPFGRSDGANLVIEALFGPVVFTVTYQEAQAQGIVSPIRAMMYALSDKEVSKAATNEMMSQYKSKVTKKRHAYWRNGARNELLARSIDLTCQSHNIENPQVLVLTETLEHAMYLKQHLPGYELVYGNQDVTVIDEYVKNEFLPEGHDRLTDARRDEMRRAFEAGALRKVIATKVWGTGINLVHLNLLVYASGEIGEIPVVQWGGRLSRVSPEGTEVKPYGILIDCADRFCEFASKRATARIRQYKKLGWTVSHPDLEKVGGYRQARLSL